jgi:hypothetical protein
VDTSRRKLSFTPSIDQCSVFFKHYLHRGPTLTDSASENELNGDNNYNTRLTFHRRPLQKLIERLLILFQAPLPNTIEPQ